MSDKDPLANSGDEPLNDIVKNIITQSFPVEEITQLITDLIEDDADLKLIQKYGLEASMIQRMTGEYITLLGSGEDTDSMSDSAPHNSIFSKSEDAMRDYEKYLCTQIANGFDRYLDGLEDSKRIPICEAIDKLKGWHDNSCDTIVMKPIYLSTLKLYREIQPEFILGHFRVDQNPFYDYLCNSIKILKY